MSGSFHVAITMDGNGRWAQRHGKNRILGHRAGAKVLKQIVRACPTYEIKFLTVYAFSTDNWKRDAVEVKGLMKLFEFYLQNETLELKQEGVCIKVIGSRSKLSPSLIKLIEWAENLTENNTRLVLQVAIDYGGREDILHAVQKLALLVKNDILNPDEITAEHITKALYTYPCPDPDLLIRTGGEVRLSNYLLWQLSYTELIFSVKYWPDFTVQDFESCVLLYKKRDRRFGNVTYTD